MFEKASCDTRKTSAVPFRFLKTPPPKGHTCGCVESRTDAPPVSGGDGLGSGDRSAVPSRRAPASAFFVPVSADTPRHASGATRRPPRPVASVPSSRRQVGAAAAAHPQPGLFSVPPETERVFKI